MPSTLGIISSHLNYTPPKAWTAIASSPATVPALFGSATINSGATKTDLKLVSGNDNIDIKIYSWNGSTWSQLGQTLTSLPGYVFGTQFNKSGTRFVAGFVDASVYRAYELIGNTWTLMGSQISSADPMAGMRVSMNDAGDRIAFTTKIYSWNGTTWTQLGADFPAETSFTPSIKLDGTGNTILRNGPAGIAKAYTWNGSTWIQKGSNLSNGTDLEFASDGGTRAEVLTINKTGDVIAMSNPFNDIPGGFNQGYIKCYSWNGSNWVQRGSLIEGTFNNNALGFYIALNEDGSRIYCRGFNGDGGAYEWNGSNWSLLAGSVPNGIGGGIGINDQGNIISSGLRIYIGNF
jgi:hypothetical protein